MTTHCCNSCENGGVCQSATFTPDCGNTPSQQHSIPGIPIAVNSGLFINANGELDIDCAVLGNKCAWPTGHAPNAQRNYTWTVAPSKVSEGDQVTVNVSGLLPYALITIRMITAGITDYIPLKADGNGNVVNAKIRMGVAAAAVVFTPIMPGGIPNVSNYSVEVLACGQVEDCTCQGAVTITPFFTDNSIVSGQPVTLTLLVKNTNSCPVTGLSLPAVQLPPQFTNISQISLSGETINGKSVKAFEFQLQAQNTSGASQNVSVTIPASSATYSCGGNLYSAGGGSVSLTIAPATGYFCGMVIDSFAFSQSSAADNTLVSLAITIRNVGSSPLYNVAMPQLNLGGANVVISAGASTIGFAAIPSIAPGATHTETVQVAFDAISNPTTHTVTIPAGFIYGTCNGSQVSNGVARSATISLL